MHLEPSMPVYSPNIKINNSRKLTIWRLSKENKNKNKKHWCIVKGATYKTDCSEGYQSVSARPSSKGTLEARQRCEVKEAWSWEVDCLSVQQKKGTEYSGLILDFFNIQLNYVNFSSCLIENTVRLHYKEK
jgi:hypothetical protein